MEMIIQDDFRRLVLEELKTQNVSKSELSRRMNVTPQYVHQYLSGRNTPGSDVMEKFFEALGYQPRLTLQAIPSLQAAG